MLALEASVEGGPGGLPHFFAVATYNVQHPTSTGYTVEAIAGLREQLARTVSDGQTISDVRRSVRHSVRDNPRIKRKLGDPVPHWRVRDWPLNVTDVVREGRSGYVEMVRRWAQSVVETVKDLDLDVTGDSL
jgi:Family of unknown function (DUF5946)